MRLKIALSKLPPHLPGDNELITYPYVSVEAVIVVICDCMSILIVPLSREKRVSIFHCFAIVYNHMVSMAAMITIYKHQYIARSLLPNQLVMNTWIRQKSPFYDRNHCISFLPGPKYWWVWGSREIIFGSLFMKTFEFSLNFLCILSLNLLLSIVFTASILRPEQNGWNFCKYQIENIFLDENMVISIEISLKCLLRVLNNSSLVEISWFIAESPKSW